MAGVAGAPDSRQPRLPDALRPSRGLIINRWVDSEIRKEKDLEESLALALEQIRFLQKRILALSL